MNANQNRRFMHGVVKYDASSENQQGAKVFNPKNAVCLQPRKQQ